MVDQRSLRSLLADWASAVAGTDLPQPPAYDGPDVLLSRLVEHTAQVAPGACFVARVRTTSDGHRYIPRAVAAGASLILGQYPLESLPLTVPAAVPYIQVNDTAQTAAWLAAAWEDFPAQHLVMVGVTGTDGKTTTANMLHTMLQAAGLRTGLLSTIRAVIGEKEEPLALHVTTPEAPVVQRYLRRMVDAGATHCVLEATSHGLAQHRVEAIPFDVAVVTNITHEHLDYHGDFEAYRGAKERLFAMLTREELRLPSQNEHKRLLERTAVLNRDDDSYRRLAAVPIARSLSYGMGDKPDICASEIRYEPAATHFRLHLGEWSQNVSTPFVGDFNVYNLMAAAGAARAVGVTPATIAKALGTSPQLAGRMERIDEGQPFLTLVDFAHTPNALERALAAARQMSSGRLIAVFGSAGKRDVEKRRLMAEIAAKMADLTILTAEDPRTESLNEILTVMASACRHHGGVEGKTFWRVPDRGKAIFQALILAKRGDIVLICGKGHEQSMCFGTVEYPWDDREATRTALKAMLNGDPMPDLGLPTFAKVED